MLTYARIFVAICSVAVGLCSTASAETASASGALQGTAGYGYRIQADWTAPAGMYKFSTMFGDYWTPVGANGFDGGLSLYAFLKPTQTQFELTSVTVEATFTFEVINLVTGVPEIPPQFGDVGNAPIWSRSWSLNGTAANAAGPAHTPEIRFSQSILHTSFSPTLPVFHICGTETEACVEPSPTNTVVYAADFLAGQYAAVSEDPNCGSVDCMPHYRDVFRPGDVLVMFAFGQSVPEPASLWLLTAGVLLIVVKLKRSKRTRAIRSH